MMISTLSLIALSFTANPQPETQPEAVLTDAITQEAPALQEEKGTDKEKGQKKGQRKGENKGQRKGEKKGTDKKGTDGEGRRGRRRRVGGETREALLKKFDADGDGKLSETERKALREHVQKQRAERKGDGEGEKKGRRRGDGARRKGDQKKKGDAKKKGDDGSAA